MKFINTTVGDQHRVRKHVQYACNICRKRKKRCEHLDGPKSPLADPSVQSSIISEAVTPKTRQSTSRLNLSGGTPQTRSARLPSTVDSHSSPDDEARFVGNLNPESTFLADSHKTSGSGYTQSDPIGVWVARRMTTDDASPPDASSRSATGQSLLGTSLSPPALEQLLHTLPLPRHYEGLKAIYLRDVHRLFPVFDLAALDKPESTVAQVLTKQAVCLAAGAHVDARALLTLGPDADPVRPLTYAQFSLRLSWAMRSLLSAGLVKDRVQIIPVYVILALYTYGLEDRQVTIEMASLAVSHVFTIGLQLQIPDSRSENPGYLATLFCCVWAMDQMNACIHGRPLMMHERDFGRDLRACIAQQEPGFRLLLETVELLDRAIELYRPGSIDLPNELVKELPTFENLIEKSGAVALDTRLLATLEILYHAVIIIACKAPPSPRLAVSSYITAQQSLSSVSITTIVEDMGDQLPCVTFLPYALSLSLRVAYRELRASKVPMLRGRSYRQLQTNCRIIRGFSGIYRPVLAIVGLVDKLLEEIDRVGQEAPADSAAQTPTPRPLDSSTGREQVPSTVVNGSGNGNGGGEGRQAGEPREMPATPAFDPTFPEGLTRVDLFEYLDPDFDLGAVDALLGDPTYPYFPNPFA